MRGVLSYVVKKETPGVEILGIGWKKLRKKLKQIEIGVDG
jgi:hypothetical protein